MKVARPNIIAISTTIMLMLASRSLAQSPKWNGKIEIENGVKVVKNPAAPLYGNFAFDLQEELAIGGDPSKENAYFPKGAVLAVNDPGDLYIADYGNRRVLMFDRAGNFIRTIGRQGQGPGEYMMPTQVFVDLNGDLIVWDGRAIIVYKADGEFVKKAVINMPFNQISLGTNETFLGTVQPGYMGNMKYSLIQMNYDGMKLRNIAEFVGELKKFEKSLFIHVYSNCIIFAAVSNTTILYGFSDDYKLTMADAEGSVKRVIIKDEQRLRISKAEKDETRKRGIWRGVTNRKLEDNEFPDNRPIFNRVIIDDLERIYISHLGSILEQTKPKEIDVFSKEGYFIYRMTWDLAPAAIKGGYFYAIREDKESGEYQVVRFKIKNWAQLKNGVS